MKLEQWKTMLVSKNLLWIWYIYFEILLRGCVHQTSGEQRSHVSPNHLAVGRQATKEPRLQYYSSSVHLCLFCWFHGHQPDCILSIRSMEVCVHVCVWSDELIVVLWMVIIQPSLGSHVQPTETQTTIKQDNTHTYARTHTHTHLHTFRYIDLHSTFIPAVELISS